LRGRQSASLARSRHERRGGPELRLRLRFSAKRERRARRLRLRFATERERYARRLPDSKPFGSLIAVRPFNAFFPNAAFFKNAAFFYVATRFAPNPLNYRSFSAFSKRDVKKFIAADVFSTPLTSKRNSFNVGMLRRRFPRIGDLDAVESQKKRENFKKAPCANRILWFNYFCSKGNRERKLNLPFLIS